MEVQKDSGYGNAEVSHNALNPGEFVYRLTYIYRKRELQ